jgi:hypothetical protein
LENKDCSRWTSTDSKNKQKDMESKRRKISLDKEYLVIFLSKCHDYIFVDGLLESN